MKDEIAIKRVKFLTGAPDFIYSAKVWYTHGGWKGFLKDNCISIRDVECVKDDLMNRSEFYSLPAWEG